MRSIQMVDLKSQYQRLKNDIDKAMQKVLDHTVFINGEEVQAFQEDLSTYMGVKHVITCGNGTDALQVALMALDLQPGDEVITTDFTFIATVEVIGLLGLKPVLVDVDLDTFNLLPSAIEKAITPRTKVIMPVHLFGQGADMDSIREIASKYHLHVIEDAAQSLGASYQLDRDRSAKLGVLGDIGCTSFFPSKNLGCYGDGGACFTNNDDLAHQMRSIVNHGSRVKYYHHRLGVNSRLDTLQAAILKVKLRHLDDFNQRRQIAAAYYNSRLAGIQQLQIPSRNISSAHIFHQYTLRIKDGSRDELRAVLQASGIPSMVYYPLPIHKQDVFSPWLPKDAKFPNSSLLAEQVVSLPMHTELDEEQMNYITTVVKNFYK